MKHRLLKIIDNIKILKDFIIQNLFRNRKHFSFIDFPINQNLIKENGVLKFENHDFEYLCNPLSEHSNFLQFLKTHQTKNIIKNNITYEAMKITKKTKKFELKAENRAYLSFSSFKKTEFEISINNSNFKSKINNGETYNISLKKDDHITIKSKDAFSFSKIFENKETKRKNNIVIFIDGLIADLITDKEKFHKYLPNTYNFFKDGTSFCNHFANSEWSLPSAGNFFTGCYTDKHKLYHNTKNNRLNENLKLLGEFFSDSNYYTFMINGSWRLSPNYGFIKGIDKTIYKSDMSSGEVIDHFFNIDSKIQDSKKFYWLTFFDLHYTGSKNVFGNNYYFNQTLPEKSVNLKSNNELKNKYLENCKILDAKLNCIYNYLDQNYKKDEFLISIVTDHGQSFFDDDENVLRDKRVKIPWLVKGFNVPSQSIHDFSENIDLLPLLLKLNNIDFNGKNLDGSLPTFLGGNKKRLAKIQSVFPNQEYKLRVEFDNNSYFFESKNLVDDNCKIENYFSKNLEIKPKINEVKKNLFEEKEAEKQYNLSCERLFLKN